LTEAYITGRRECDSIEWIGEVIGIQEQSTSTGLFSKPDICRTVDIHMKTKGICESENRSKGVATTKSKTAPGHNDFRRRYRQSQGRERQFKGEVG